MTTVINCAPSAHVRPIAQAFRSIGIAWLIAAAERELVSKGDGRAATINSIATVLASLLRAWNATNDRVCWCRGKVEDVLCCQEKAAIN
jgi:hypothetical protein